MTSDRCPIDSPQPAVCKTVAVTKNRVLFSSLECLHTSGDSDFTSWKFFKLSIISKS